MNSLSDKSESVRGTLIVNLPHVVSWGRGDMWAWPVHCVLFRNLPVFFSRGHMDTSSRSLQKALDSKHAAEQNTCRVVAVCQDPGK